MTATISPCGTYRYDLTRTWATGLPTCCWVMLNPSTADAQKDDPTIRKCCGFANLWGFGGIVVVNLFAYRSTDPMALYEREDIVGPENNTHILKHALTAGKVVAGWGVHGSIKGRSETVRKLLLDQGVVIECLKTSKSGQPYHPLYLPGHLTPIPWTGVVA